MLCLYTVTLFSADSLAMADISISQVGEKTILRKDYENGKITAIGLSRSGSEKLIENKAEIIEKAKDITVCVRTADNPLKYEKEHSWTLQENIKATVNAW